MAEILVKRAEEALIPDLSNMIEEYDVATPLTNIRYTGNPEGAIYGYEQSTQNSFLNRIDNRTPIRHLYLASSWGTPGGGICGALRSGQQTFRCLIDDWFKEARAAAY
jgi:prolycopene isomerase